MAVGMKKRFPCAAVVTAALLTLVTLISPFTGCGGSVSQPEGEKRWTLGYAEETVPTEEETYYMAGYRNDHAVSLAEALDGQKVKAVWLSTGESGVLLAAVDCVGLTSDTVEAVRTELRAFCRESNCDAVHVCATHTHAGIDTMGLWGPVAEDGKSETFQTALVETAVRVCKAAYENRKTGELYYAYGDAGDLQRDSRQPQVYDRNLYQIRFVPEEGSGIRILNYAAHAESLRGNNDRLSADFPGETSRLLKEATGDDVLFFAGAVGGLIMTRELTDPFDAVENRNLTAACLAQTACSLTEEEKLNPQLQNVTVPFAVPLDNTLFLYYKFLGILDSQIERLPFTGEYRLQTSLSVLRLGSLTLALLPGEIFPELVSGGALTEAVANGADNPPVLTEIAADAGVDTGHLLIFGLADDEIGYIIPPSDYLLDGTLPYFREAVDATGRKHYEETNSVGITAANEVATAFGKALAKLPIHLEKNGKMSENSAEKK